MSFVQALTREASYKEELLSKQASSLMFNSEFWHPGDLSQHTTSGPSRGLTSSSKIPALIAKHWLWPLNPRSLSNLMVDVATKPLPPYLHRVDFSVPAIMLCLSSQLSKMQAFISLPGFSELEDEDLLREGDQCLVVVQILKYSLVLLEGPQKPFSYFPPFKGRDSRLRHKTMTEQ